MNLKRKAGEISSSANQSVRSNVLILNIRIWRLIIHIRSMHPFFFLLRNCEKAGTRLHACWPAWLVAWYTCSPKRHGHGRQTLTGAGLPEDEDELPCNLHTLLFVTFTIPEFSCNEPVSSVYQPPHRCILPCIIGPQSSTSYSSFYLQSTHASFTWSYDPGMILSDPRDSTSVWKKRLILLVSFCSYF